MIKRILLDLNDSPFAYEARAYALKLAGEHRAHLTALALIDLARLTQGEAIPAGALAFQQQRNRVWLNAWRTQADMLIDACRQQALVAGVGFTGLCIEDEAPAAALVREARHHDLLVSATDAQLGSAGASEDSLQLAHYLADAPRPLLLLAKTTSNHSSHPDGPILIAYDGSACAARMLQQLAFMQLWPRSPKRLIVIHPSQADAETLAAEAAGYLASHGIKVTAVAIGSTLAAADILLAECAAHHAQALAMGAFGHNSWRERLFGSATRTLLARANCPLLLAH
ncbi:universal stress protein [Craterilacuibacter sp. RT1T]|uniref:universal stress protein n=1 Tax=Craterilacuibacter sp. RT1T TaxID=2942211 RepID=UPI0020C0B93D|nr:universal stress protein [Craterilacuibacter sp. RT1T]MCL6262328.1 universal stress protein [Craterilacuibacter sp. RT1T]